MAGAWRREPRWVHRLVPDHVMLAAPGGEERTIGGLALVVWVVLDTPGTVAEVVDRARELWPDAPVDPAAVESAIALLHESGLVAPAGPGEAP